MPLKYKTKVLPQILNCPDSLVSRYTSDAVVVDVVGDADDTDAWKNDVADDDAAVADDADSMVVTRRSRLNDSEDCRKKQRRLEKMSRDARRKTQEDTRRKRRKGRRKTSMMPRRGRRRNTERRRKGRKTPPFHATEFRWVRKRKTQ